MYVVVVTLWAKAEFAEKFLAATLANARGTRKEPGNLRFDVIRGEDDPTRFMLYEVYRKKEDFAAHQQTAHYFTWRDSVGDWMARPREASKYETAFYGDGGE